MSENSTAAKAWVNRTAPAGAGGRDTAAMEIPATEALDALLDFVRQRRRLVVLTGAGCSTASGIPDYRDDNGDWKRTQPIRFQAFTASAATRRRYWARSLLGWETVAAAQPNAAHRALAQLEAQGWIYHLITQNVDGLHQRANSRSVIDLHGRLDMVECLHCGTHISRAAFQADLAARNPDWRAMVATAAPDGDADLDGVDFADFEVPDCSLCAGTLKPGVVFFGEAVPKARVRDALAQVEAADGLLVVGSSLMVWSGYRFIRAARARQIDVAAVNLGRTRADSELTLKISAACGPLLSAATEGLGTHRAY